MGLADAMRGFCVFYAWGVVMNATAELHRPAAPDQDAVTPAAAPRLPARQMVRAMVWAAVLGGLTAAIAAPHVDAALIPVLVVTGAGAGFVASIDIDTRHIYNRHIVVIAAATVAGLVFAQLSGQDVAARALLAAVGAFVYMLALALPRMGLGGGDIKYAPVAAAGLATVGLYAVLLWLLFTFGAALVAMAALKARGHLADTDDAAASSEGGRGDDTGGAGAPVSAGIPLGPCMALAVVAAIPAFAWLSELLPAGGL